MSARTAVQVLFALLYLYLCLVSLLLALAGLWVDEMLLFVPASWAFFGFGAMTIWELER